MEIRDPVHGSITIPKEEVAILEHPFFQRLRRIKQLGFSEYAFPGATHTRYIHSIGVMHVASMAFDKIFPGPHSKEFLRLKETLRLAALLHDIGHAPLSHATESVMPSLEKLKLNKRFLTEEANLQRQATHEDYTVKSVTDSSLTQAFQGIRDAFGVDFNAIAELIAGNSTDDAYFVVNGVNYFPLLHQLISSEMDCDRMDYLLRDSYFCGVSYGKYDLPWILDNLKPCIVGSQAYLGIGERAVSTFDDFLLSRFHMFLMVYFHYRSVCLEQMLMHYFNSSENEYRIPPDIEDYINHDDQHLMRVIRASDNKWAQKVALIKIPPKIIECFGPRNLELVNRLETYLEDQQIEYIRSSSTGRLSKYYTPEEPQELRPKYPMKVERWVYGKSQTVFSNIDESTELFQKFSESHAVNRIHCDINDLTAKQQKEIYQLI